MWILPFPSIVREGSGRRLAKIEEIGHASADAWRTPGVGVSVVA
jgi:hypothetical protein